MQIIFQKCISINSTNEALQMVNARKLGKTLKNSVKHLVVTGKIHIFAADKTQTALNWSP